MSAQAEHRHEPFHNPALTRQMNKAVEMLYNGFTRKEIMDEMDISDRHLNRLFSDARKRGEPVPRGRTGRPIGLDPINGAPIGALVRVRSELRLAGVKRGIHKQIAERFGLTANNVKVRLWHYDNGRRAY